MNYKKIMELCEGILKNLECKLHEGKPCGTCSSAIYRDIIKLNEEIKEKC